MNPIVMATICQWPQICAHSIVAGTGEQNGLGLGMGAKRVFQHDRGNRLRQTCLRVKGRQQIDRGDVQQGHGVIDALVTASVQNQRPAGTHRPSQHSLNALCGATGEKQGVLRTAQTGKKRFCLPYGAFSIIQVSCWGKLCEVQSCDLRKGTGHTSLVAGHMKSKRLLTGQLHKGLIKRCVHKRLPNRVYATIISWENGAVKKYFYFPRICA